MDRALTSLRHTKLEEEAPGLERARVWSQTWVHNPVFLHIGLFPQLHRGYRAWWGGSRRAALGNYWAQHFLPTKEIQKTKGMPGPFSTAWPPCCNFSFLQQDPIKPGSLNKEMANGGFKQMSTLCFTGIGETREVLEETQDPSTGAKTHF